MNMKTTLKAAFAAILALSLLPASPLWAQGSEEETGEANRVAQQSPPFEQRERRERFEQMSPEEREQRRAKMEEMRETVQLWRIHKMREVLELTDAQTTQVMKIEDDKTKREHDLGGRFEGTMPKVREMLEKNAPDKDIQAQLDAMLKLRDERRRIEDDYEMQMRKALSPRQQLKFLIFQKEFDRRVREMVAERRMERREGEPGEPPMPPPPPRRPRFDD